jgi:hypothetical protein
VELSVDDLEALNAVAGPSFLPQEDFAAFEAVTAEPTVLDLYDMVRSPDLPSERRLQAALTLEQQRMAAQALPPDAPLNRQFAAAMGNGNFARYAMELIPFGRHGWSTARSISRGAAQRRVEAGKGTPEDFLFLAGEMALDDQYANKGITKTPITWLADQAARLPATGTELYATGGLAAPAGALLPGLAGTAARYGLQGALTGQAASAAAARYEQGDAPLTAVGRGVVDAAVEVGSEQMLGRGFGSKRLAKAGLQDPVTEVTEEVLADVGRGVTSIPFADKPGELEQEFGMTGKIAVGAATGDLGKLGKGAAEAAGVAAIAGGYTAPARIAEARQERRQFESAREALQTQKTFNDAAWGSSDYARSVIDQLRQRGVGANQLRSLARNPSSQHFERLGLGRRKERTMPGAHARRQFGEHALQYLDELETPPLPPSQPPAATPDVTPTPDIATPDLAPAPIAPLAETPPVVEPPAPPPTASVPMMVTRQMEQQLRDLGFPQEAIDKLRPDEAWQAINNKQPYKPVVEAPKPTPFEGKVFRGHGRTDQGEVYGEGAAGPIFGPAGYFAMDAKDAESYGPNVEETNIRLENPLVIDSDQALEKFLGRKIPRDNEARSKLFPKARERAEKAGYDGIVIHLPLADVNDRGESVKRMAEVFSHSQVVSFKQPEKAPPKFTTPPPVPHPEESVGRPTKIAAADKEYPAQYRLMNLADLIPSHDFWRGSPGDNVAAGRFPESLQPRNYNDPAEAAKVREHARAQQAHYWLEDTLRAEGGPPTVAPSGIVFNGNSRVMSLQMAAGEKKYDWYKSALREKAQHFGIDPSQVDAMELPILVRVVDIDPASPEASAFAREGNVSVVHAQSPVRTASSLAGMIDADLIESVPIPEDGSFSDIVGTGKTGREFRERIRAALPPSVAPQYFDKDGNLNDVGRELVRDMLLTRVLPVDTVERLLNNRKQLAATIEKSLLPLLKMGKTQPKMLEAFQAAAALFAEKPDIKTLGDLRAEFGPRLFGEKKYNNATKMLAALMLRDGDKPRVFAGKLGRMLKGLEVTGKGGLFSEQEEKPPAGVVAEELGVDQEGEELFNARLRATAKPVATKEIWQMTEAEWKSFTKGPPVPAGHTRLYRGQAIGGVGNWFTTDLDEVAELNASNSGPDSEIVFVDVPNESLDSFADAAMQKNKSHGQWAPNESAYYVPAKVSSRAKRLKPGGSHEMAVMNALAAGKPVPPEVLADYPDLQAEMRATATAPSSSATGPAAPWARSKAETRAGLKLLRSIENDSTTRPTVGVRSISDFLIRELKGALIVLKGQTSRRHPAHMQNNGTGVVMSSTGAFALNYHEGGHVLSAWLRDQHKGWYRAIAPALKAYASVMPHASSVSSEEGLAELVRVYIVDQTKAPPSLVKGLEKILAEKNPTALAILRDAHRAHQSLVSKPTGEYLQALNNDRGKPQSYGTAALQWYYAFADFFVGNAATIDYLRRRAFTGIVSTEKAISNKRVALAKARQYQRDLVDTPASVRAAYHARLHATDHALAAIGGDRTRSHGVRVMLWGKYSIDHQGIEPALLPGGQPAGFSQYEDYLLDAMREAGFIIPKDPESRHGHFLELHGTSLHQIRQMVGEKEWPAFTNWLQYRVAWERHIKTGAEFSGQHEGRLEQIKAFIKEGNNNSKWVLAGKEIEQFFRQLLLLDVLSGQITPAEAIKITTAYEHYVPLFRVREEFDLGGRGGGSPAQPTAPVRRQFGSLRQFEDFDKNAVEYVMSTFGAYYDQLMLDAVLYESRLSGKDKSLPYEFRAMMKRTMVPLRLERTKVATATPGEMLLALVDSLNRMTLEELGWSPKTISKMNAKEVEEAVETEGGEVVTTGDINIFVPGLPIYRNTAPKAKRVVARWVNGERQYYLVTDPVVFQLFSARKIGGEDSPFLKLLARAATGLTAPWKRAITHSPKFGIRSLTRDPWAGLWFGQDLFNRKGGGTTKAEDFIPQARLVNGVLHQVFKGNLSPDVEQTIEMAKKALDHYGTDSFGAPWSSPADVAKSFMPAELKSAGWEVLKEGIAPPESWNMLTTAEKMAEMPGMAMSAMLKPIDVVHWMMGSRRFAAWQETTPRAEAWIRSAEEGLSPAEAQVAFDSITGLFAGRPSNEMLHQLYRAAGFLNPFLQTTFQSVAIMTHPDPKVRNAALFVRLPYFALLGAGSAALMYALRAAIEDDDEWWKPLAEQKERERLTHMDVFGIRLPMPHGIEGAFFSLGYNTVLDSLLKNPIDAKQRALSLAIQAADPVGIEDFTQPHARTSIELARDWSFHMQRTIVPETLRERYPDNPERWTRPDTPAVYEAIAKGGNVSPLQVQYAVRNGVASQYDDVLTWLAGSGKDPITKGLVYDELRHYNARSVEQLDRLDKQYNAIKRELTEKAERDPKAAQLLTRLETAHRVNLEVDRLVGELQRLKADGDQQGVKRLESTIIDVARAFIVEGRLHPAIEETAIDAERKAMRRGVRQGEGESREEFEARQEDNRQRQERARRIISGS